MRHPELSLPQSISTVLHSYELPELQQSNEHAKDSKGSRNGGVFPSLLIPRDSWFNGHLLSSPLRAGKEKTLPFSAALSDVVMVECIGHSTPLSAHLSMGESRMGCVHGRRRNVRKPAIGEEMLCCMAGEALFHCRRNEMHGKSSELG